MRDPLDFTEMTTSSGLRLFHHETDESTIRTYLAYNVGHAHDPFGKEGCAHVLEHQFHAGTEGYPWRDYTTYKEWLEKQPFDFIESVSTDMFDMKFRGVCTTEAAADWLAFLNAFTRHPTLKQDIAHDLAIVRQERIKRGDQSRPLKASRLLDEAFGNAKHRISSATGLPEDEVLNGLTHDDLQHLHERHFHPANAVLLSYGGIADKAWETLAEAAFPQSADAWKGHVVFDAPAFRRPDPRMRTLKAEDGKPVSSIQVKYAWFYPQELGSEAVLAQNLLRSELQKELRERQRAVYAVDVSSSTMFFASTFSISSRTDPKHQQTVCEGIETALRHVTPLLDGLQRQQDHSKKIIRFSDDKPQGLMSSAFRNIQTRGKIRTIAQGVQRLDAVTRESLARFLTERLDPDLAYVEIIENP